MALQHIVIMAGSRSLIERTAACAASQGILNPLAWAEANIWRVAAHEGFADAWAEAATDTSGNFNPDTGRRTDVITDSMLEDAVRAAQPLVP